MKPGRKPNGEASNLKLFNMKAPPEFYQAIDDWRRAQPSIISRSEAVRVLVYRSIETEKQA